MNLFKTTAHVRNAFFFVSLTWLITASSIDTVSVKETPVNPRLLENALQEKACQHWVDSLMNCLSVKEKIGQLFVYTIAPVETKRNLALLHQAVNTYKVGGLLFSGGKLQGQVALTNRAQREARVPLMITFDGEWGLSMRLRGTPVFPRNMVLGSIQDNQLIYAYGREVARQCRELGVQVNFAPVADVNINPQNPVINTRSFGQDPGQVAAKMVAYGLGLEAGGVLSVCKHFPGHGDTDVDSHKALPLLPFTRERLDSVELYPFKEAIRSGLGAVMVGHLQVPALDPTAGMPASLSRKIVSDLLTDELGFKGLIFTDALAMNGVSTRTQVSLEALKAGNDVVLSPPKLKEEMEAVYRAVEQGELSMQEIDAKCRKVLTYKYALGLKKRPHVQLSGLDSRLYTEQTRDLQERLNRAAITVVVNHKQTLPLPPSLQEVALLEVGDARSLTVFAKQLARTVKPVRFSLRSGMSEAQMQQLTDSLALYKRVIVAVSEQQLTPHQAFFSLFSKEVPAVYLFFTPESSVLHLQQALATAHAVVLAHTTADGVQSQVADVLVGKGRADGRLPSNMGRLFCAGDGVTIDPESGAPFSPEAFGFRPDLLTRIDSIAGEGIRHGAYPGCQVVLLKEGQLLVDKSYGTQAGAGSAAITSQSSYDLASLTKTTATLLALMKLYDQGRFNLSDKLSDHLPWLRQTNKKEITIREVLLHQSGLPSGIALYPDLIDKSSYSGRLMGAKRSSQHTLRLTPGLWANPNFRWKRAYISSVRTGDYTLPVSEKLWLNRSYRQEIEQMIAQVAMKDKTYRYSDVGFILLGMLVEQLADLSIDAYLQREFYGPMELKRTAYLPLRKQPKEEIVPSAVDPFLRKDTLRGYVHDESAAFQGGIAGHAGLFSTAGEVARIYQLLLNGGELDGKRYLSTATCHLFTTEQSAISRRGLGFDKPDAKNPTKGNCAPATPASVYGHTGFTGTCAWVDPENRLVYVFLSNRTYPESTNRKLQQLAIREQIQAAIYQAMK